MRIHKQTLRACAAALVAFAALSLLYAGPAGAVTGGAGTTASIEAEEGAGLAFTPMKWGGATWYGPGFYGHRTACGGTLSPGRVGVANKTLPCGTRVRLRYRGRTVTAPVIDRGPYAGGRTYDLTAATKQRLRFGSTGTVWSSK